MLLLIGCNISRRRVSCFISMALHILIALFCISSSALLLSTTSAAAIKDFRHIQDQCIANCPFQNSTDGVANDLWCDEECSIEHCIAGCRQWRKALHSSCYSSCNSTQGHARGQALYCLMGCNSAVSSYVTEVKELIGKIPAPVPIIGSLSNSSVSLRWSWNSWTALLGWPSSLSGGARNDINTGISLQWRHSQAEMGGTWAAVSSTSRDDQSQQATVKELQPYTSYRFRVVAVLASDREPLTSDESQTITTLPYGPPSTPPLKLQAVVLDSTRISISWDPPFFPNGPLISYSLTIKEASPSGPNVYPGFQDIVGINRARSYIFVHLNPGTTYSISVSARNAEGPGPEAFLQSTTLPLEKSGNSLEPFIVIVVDNKLIYRHTTGLIHESFIHASSMNITGLAVHTRQGTLFIADDHCRVYELSLSSKGRSEVKTSWQVSDDPKVSIKGLSVDWLSDRLYLLLGIADGSSGGSWQIARSKLNGRELTHVVTDMSHRPFQIEVDPFNGFLIWGVQDGPKGGLYQVDLADLVDHPLSAVTDGHKIKKIVDNESVSAFKSDPANSQIFVMVSHEISNKTIMAVPYTGSLSPTVTRHSMSRLVDQVSSLNYLDGVFYWINKGHSVYEEIDSQGELYVNNFAPMADSHHTSLLLCDVKSQPIPIPLTPIRHLQALFEPTSTHIKWDPPSPLAHRGRGAWRNWSYRMQMVDMESGASVFRDDISTTEMDVEDLRPNTTYTITVQPSSRAGNGVSTGASFVGKTLPDGKQTIYWATGGTIQQSSATGKDVIAFSDVTHIAGESIEIVSMAYMIDSIYAVTNASRMYKISLQSRRVSLLENIEAISVATDLLGKRIYWSSLKRQTIGRSLHDGSQIEWLPIIGIVTSLAIHSTKGKLVWCTGHSIEGSNLNGDKRQMYWSSGLLSGNQAIGMTMDYDREEVFWMVMQLNGASRLYKSQIDFPQSTVLVNQVDLSPSREGPMQYMSDRLLWLQETSVMVAITDLQGSNSYSLGSPKQQRVSSFLVEDSSRYSLPANANVIPNAVDGSTIAINQSSNGTLLISWSPVANVNFGTLSYDIRVGTVDHNGTAVTTNSSYLLPSDWRTPPYSEISISIRAFTVWSSAAVSDARLRSPPSTPEAPLSPRVYVSFIRDEANHTQTGVLVDFRWSPPVKFNGELIGYKIECWNEKDDTKLDLCQKDANIVPPIVNDYSIRTLMPNESYYFTVQAFTQVGYGPKTAPLLVSTSKETPVPQLLIFTVNSHWLVDLDKQKSLNKSLAKSVSTVQFPPVAVAFINQERQLYWIDSQGDLYSHELGTHLLKKIYHLNGTGRSLAVDWVSRNIYWSQTDSLSGGGTSVYRLDLNVEPVTASLVLRDANNMAKLVEVDPFTSRLIWISISKNGTGTLMASDVSGRATRPFFSHRDLCDSSTDLTGSTMSQPPAALIASSPITAVDWSNAQRPRFVWISAMNEDVWSSDWNGCHSIPEFSSSELKRAGGWPPSSLAVDRSYFYWSNANEGRVYKIRRSLSAMMDSNTKYNDRTNSASPFSSKGDVSAEQVADVRNIATLGANFQPLPGNECLAPLALSYSVKFISSTDTNATFSMPVPQRPKECLGITMASARYHLYYGPADQCRQNISHCLVHTTSQDKAVLNDLLPFTKYVIRVRITNYYRPMEYSVPLGEPFPFSTEPGAPSKPDRVTIAALSPRAVRVQWLKPTFLNGYNVSYYVYWEEFGLTPSSRNTNEGHSKWSGNDEAIEEFSLDIPTLLPNRNYTFWVRACSVNGKWNTSDPVIATTYEEPRPLLLKNVSSNFMILEWISPKDSTIQRHSVEISPSKQNKWTAIEGFTETQPDEVYHYTAENLTSLTSYSFRLKLEYAPLGTPYTWPSEDEEGFVRQTKGNAPAQPRTPQAKKSPDNLVELWWGPTPTNGYPIQFYVLEMKTIMDDQDLDDKSNTSSSTKRDENKAVKLPEAPSATWIPIYNGSDHFFVAHNLSSGPRYQFRVQAFNEMGASEMSIPSPTLQIDNLVREGAPSSVNMILSVSVSALIAFCSVMTIFLFYACRRPPFNGKKAKGEGSIHHPTSNSEMTDLATLRELPQRENFVQQNNALYGVGVGDCDLDQELALLPHIRFDDLGITKFLGRGAFGEVFEGNIKPLSESNQAITRVAVKTLRKGASEQEKGEFLKEAILMSHFKHKHIIRLLGVCLDADPNFILLELMEGGDLLSYLRNNRPSPRHLPQQSDVEFCTPLGLLDLVSMCVDVAKGCCYMEELHFVHRDLAARNCLVSSLDPCLRVVKIGDFGLARDIYRNDYYRKEGEGLLPVRWMAPESLVDGVFTSQTDVWSFGVLLWEILTLGQQPYPARTNLQVLHFVRDGGRLDRPPNCPDSLFALMMCCWAYEPGARPTFTQCLLELVNLQDKLKNSPFTAVHNGLYVGDTRTYRDGCDNKAYFFQDENHNASSDSWETHPSSSSGSCAYLEQHALEPPISSTVHYTNDPSLTALNRSTMYGLGRSLSSRNPVRRNGVIGRSSVARSNSSSGDNSGRVPNDRYLELLSESRYSCSSSSLGVTCREDYQVPRTVNKVVHYSPVAKKPVKRTQSSNSSHTDLSDVTDESCVANSPTPLSDGGSAITSIMANTFHPTASSSLDSALTSSSEADF